MNQSDRLVSLPADEPLLDYYRGTFDSAFVAIHPFFTVPGTHPLDCDYGTQIFLRSEMPGDADLIEYADAAGAQRSRAKKLDWDETQKRMREGAIAFSWLEVAEAAGMSDPRHIDRALRTCIGGLRSDLADEAGADALVEHCNAHSLFRPTEGDFQPIMRAGIVTLFRRAGVNRVIVGDEFGDEEREIELTALESEPNWDLIPYGIKRIRDVAGTLLVIVPWDRFLTVIASTRARASQTMPQTLFEGFWARPFTTTNWFREPCVPFGGAHTCET